MCECGLWGQSQLGLSRAASFGGYRCASGPPTVLGRIGGRNGARTDPGWCLVRPPAAAVNRIAVHGVYVPRPGVTCVPAQGGAWGLAWGFGGSLDSSSAGVS